METLAVVCDDNNECAEARDEALCRTGADKYNPIAYVMTALMCLVYVVLKLVWFFHLQYQPVGDEKNEMEMEEMEGDQPRPRRKYQQINFNKICRIFFFRKLKRILPLRLGSERENRFQKTEIH